MGIFDITEDTIMALYKRAWYDCNRGFVDPRKYPDLDHALTHFAMENNCTYDQAYILAKTGKRLF